jgi:hypothetical protein
MLSSPTCSAHLLNASYNGRPSPQSYPGLTLLGQEAADRIGFEPVLIGRLQDLIRVTDAIVEIVASPLHSPTQDARQFHGLQQSCLQSTILASLKRHRKGD